MPDRRAEDSSNSHRPVRGTRETGGRRRGDSEPRADFSKKWAVGVVALVNLVYFVLEALASGCNRLIL